MKKLTAFAICLLLAVSMLSVQVFAAENTQQTSGPVIPVVEGKSFVEIDGKTVQVDELEKMGYQLVLTPVMWNGEFNEQADKDLKEAYEALKKIPVAEQVDDFGDETYWHQTGKNGYELANVLDYDFFDAAVVKTSDNTVVESAKVTLTITVPYAAEIRQVLNQYHGDAAWNAVNYTAEKGEITCTDGATGLYAFLIPEGADLTAASDEETDFVPSAEQTTPTDPTEDAEYQDGDRFVFTTAVWYAENTADKALEAAYNEMVKVPVDELTYNDGGEKLKSEAQKGGFDLDKLAVSDFLDVSIVNGETEIESEQVIFEIPVAYASDVRLVLHQLPDGTWKVAQLMVKPGNDTDKVMALTVSDGGTGVYAILVDEAVREDIIAGKYCRADLFA